MLPLEIGLAHYADRQSLVTATGEVAGQMWADVNPAKVLDSWAAQLPEMTAVVSGAQLGAARQSDRYVTAVLDAEGVDAAAESAINPRGFAGYASDGRGLAELLANPAFTVLQVIGSGGGVPRAMAAGRANLDMLVRTQVADMGRYADQVAMTTRPHCDGYIRVAVGNSCARCLLLSGGFYQHSAAFQRHPRCDCTQVPAGKVAAGRLRVPSPEARYARMTPAQRSYAGFSRADQRAIADGADLGQVVNAKRGMYSAGGRTYTTEGTTKRGLAGERLGAGRGKPAIRTTPEQIYRDAGGNRAEELRQLYRHGYLLQEPAAAVRAELPVAASVAGGRAGKAASDIRVRPSLEAARTTYQVQGVFIREAMGITGRFIPTSFTGSAATAREHAEGLLRALERFPDAKLSSVLWSDLGTSYAQTQGSHIVFAEHWASPAQRSNYLRSLAGDVDAGWHTVGATSPMSVALHEFGHLIDFTNAGRVRGAVRAAVSRRAVELGVDEVALIEREISGYAATHTDELIGEAFADVMLRGEAASALSREVFDILAAEYRVGGGVVRDGTVARSVRAPMTPARFDAAAKRAATGDRALSSTRLPTNATEAEIRSLDRYGGDGSYNINRGLREGSGDLVPLSERHREAVQGIDALMARSGAKSDLTVYRVVERSKSQLGNVDEIADLTGRTWTDFGYTSTSVGARSPNYRAVVMRIRVPKGTGALSDVRRLDTDEVLLQRGLQFRVVADHGLTGSYRHIDVEVLPTVKPAAPKPRTVLTPAERAEKTRQATIVKARSVAGMAQEVSELVANGASTRALTARVEAAAKRLGTPPAVKDAILRAVATEDPAQVLAAVGQAVKGAKLTAVGEAGAVARFDRKVADAVGNARIEDGAMVRVLRPGYSAKVGGQVVQLERPVVRPLAADEVEQIRRAEARAAARERARQIEVRSTVEQTLAELDELIVKKAARSVFEERLAIAQGIDPKDLVLLRAAAGDATKMRAQITRVGKKAGITVDAKAGVKVKYDPALHDPVGAVPAEGAPMVVIRRGTSVTVDGKTIILNKAAVVKVADVPVKKAAPAKKATPPAKAGPASTADYDRRVAEVARLTKQEAVETRELGGGYSAYTNLHTTRDGQWVEKIYGERMRESSAQAVRAADAEQLGAAVLDAVGVQSAAVERIGRGRVGMEFLEAPTAAERGIMEGYGQHIPAEIVASDDARMMGLADILIGNSDRNTGNWVIRSDGRLGGYDHGAAFQPGAAALREFDGGWNPFSRYLTTAVDEDTVDIAWAATNDLSRADLAIVRARLEALRPQFVEAKRVGWHNQIMARLKEIEKRATGTRDRIAAEAPAKVAKKATAPAYKPPTKAVAATRVKESVKSRTQKPAGYPERAPIPKSKAAWAEPYPTYDPPSYTAPSVLAADRTKMPVGGDPVKYWADPADVRDVTRPFTSYEGPVQLDAKGRPLNPYTRTGIEDRGLLGRWGANYAADPIVTRVNPVTGRLEMATIKRGDTGEWAIPGGMVDEGEAVSATLAREFREETGAALDMSSGRQVYQGYVDDPRNTDNAWMETTAVHRHLTSTEAAQVHLGQADDAGEITGIRWAPVDQEFLDNLYASHGDFVRSALRDMSTDASLSVEVRAQAAAATKGRTP